MRGLLLVLLLAACGPATPPPTHRATTPPAADCSGCASGSTECAELATARAHATDGSRDYTAAAELLTCGCAFSDGDPAACRTLAQWTGMGRGVDLDVNGAWDLIVRACDHGDATACAFLLGGGRTVSPDLVRAASTAAATSCDGGDDRACGGLIRLMVLIGDHSRDDYLSLMTRGCRAGDAWACEAWKLASPDAAPQIADLLAGFCAAGDLDLCTDRDVVAEKCEAHDWSACEELGRSQWPHDLELLTDACAHDFAYACESVGDQLRDAGGQDTKVGQLLTLACDLGSDSACTKAADPAHGAGCAALGVLDDLPLATLPGLRGLDRAGKKLSIPTGAPMVVIVWAPWNGPSPELLDQLAAELAPLRVVVLASMTADQPAPAGRFELVVDVPTGDDNLGAQTRALGIEKVTEALVIGADGTILRRVVLMSVDRNLGLCVADAFAP